VLRRREAIVAGGSALLIAGCGRSPVRKLAGNPSDLPRLREALEVERAEIAVLELGLQRLQGRPLAIARVALAHERAHADAVAEAIRELGAKPPAPRDPAGYARRMSRDPHRFLVQLVEFQNGVASSYETRLPATVNVRLRATFAAIMTTEAEHAAAFGALL
jgi:hypothetical protein